MITLGQVSKKKLERMAITGGNFARPGERSDGGELSAEKLKALLSDDIQDLELKGELEKQDVYPAPGHSWARFFRNQAQLSEVRVEKDLRLNL